MRQTWPKQTLKGFIGFLAAGLLFSGLSAGVQAAPSGGVVTQGDGGIHQVGPVTTVTQRTHKLAVNWNRFDIGAGEKVQFIQPGSSSIALNRVLGTNATAIFGALTANGKVFLINPNGVLFAPGAQVNVGGLVASTLNLSDSDFLAGNYVFTKNGNAGAVVNQGTLTAVDGGYIVFLGPQTRNEGIVTARLGTVGLVAGERVSLDFDGDSLLSFRVDTAASGAGVNNSGRILADGGTVLMSTGTKDALLSTVVNNTGLVQAQTVDAAGGTIRLEGSTVTVAGKLDASAPQGGHGGFIETSGATVTVDPKATITAAAPSGKAGTWLLDPTDITVDQTIAANIQDTLNKGTDVQQLADNNITVSSDISWTSGNTLTLSAGNLLTFNAGITASGAGAGLALKTGNGTYSLGSKAQITLSGAHPSFSLNGKAYTVINSLGVPGSTTGADLQGMNGNLNVAYFLGADIDAGATSAWNGGAGFTPIGYLSPFAGTFDGGGHKIIGLHVNGTGAIGLFGKASGATIRNIGLTGGSFTGKATDAVGSLVGSASSGATTISNCSNTGAVSGGLYTGGLVGFYGDLGAATLANLYNSGTVTGNGHAGGLIGQNNNVSLTLLNSHNTGAVSTDSAAGRDSYYAGGLIGYNYSASNAAGTITTTYNTGSVSNSAANDRAASAAGGLVGGNTANLTINTSYNTGAITGYNKAGGLTGYSKNVLTINNSYNNGAVSGYHYVAGLVGGSTGTLVMNTSYSSATLTLVGTPNPASSCRSGLVCGSGNFNSSFYDKDTSGVNTGKGGLSTKAMQTATTFINAKPDWNISIWQLADGDYPRLAGNPLKISTASPLGDVAAATGLSLYDAYAGALAYIGAIAPAVSLTVPAVSTPPGPLSGLPLVLVGKGINTEK